MKKYEVGNICDLKMINNTEETIFEGKVPTNEAINIINKLKENLIPLTMKLDDTFEIDIFVTNETYKKLQEYNENLKEIKYE